MRMAQLARRTGVARCGSTAFELRSQRSDRFSAVSNLFFTGARFEFVKYWPETPLRSGDEAKYTEVCAPREGETESGSDKYDTSRSAPGACSIMRVRTIPGCTAFAVTEVSF